MQSLILSYFRSNNISIMSLGKSKTFLFCFNSKNYLAWAFHFLICVKGKDIWGHIDGSNHAPDKIAVWSSPLFCSSHQQITFQLIKPCLSLYSVIWSCSPSIILIFVPLVMCVMFIFLYTNLPKSRLNKSNMHFLDIIYTIKFSLLWSKPSSYTGF